MPFTAWVHGAGRATRPVAAALRAFGEPASQQELVDLTRRYDELGSRVAELQWDLGGLVYEMAIRDSIRVDVIVRRAAELQTVDAELSEVERILRLEQTGTAGECAVLRCPALDGRDLLLAVWPAAPAADFRRRHRRSTRALVPALQTRG